MGSKGDSALFRSRALAALEEQHGVERPEVLLPRTTLGAFALLSCFLLSITAFCVFGEVELPGKATAVVRRDRNSVTVSSAVSGPVLSAVVRSGDYVKAGQVLVSLSSAELESAKQAAQEQLDWVRAQRAKFESSERKLLEDRRTIVGKQLALDAALLTNAQRDASRLRQRLQKHRALEKEGIVSAEQTEALASRLDAADSAVLERQVHRAALDLELNDLASRLTEQEKVWAQRVTDAEQALRASARVAQQSVIVAPQNGRVEALNVEVGQHLAAGAPICKVVPDGNDWHLVAFVPQADAAFIKPGDRVSIELQGFSRAEFGRATGRVAAMALDASPDFELHELIKADGAGVSRVDVTLEQSSQNSSLLARARPGAPATLRYVTRRRSLLGLVLSQTQKWIDY